MNGEDRGIAGKIRRYFVFPVSVIGAVMTSVSIVYFVSTGDYDGLVKSFGVPLPADFVNFATVYGQQIAVWAQSWFATLLTFAWFQMIAAMVVVVALATLAAVSVFFSSLRSTPAMVAGILIATLPITIFVSVSAAQLSGKVFPNIDQYPQASGGTWTRSVTATNVGWTQQLQVSSQYALQGVSQNSNRREVFVIVVLALAIFGASILYGLPGFASALVVSLFGFLVADTYLEVRNYPRPPAANSPQMPQTVHGHACTAALNSQLQVNEEIVTQAVAKARGIEPSRTAWLMPARGVLLTSCMQFETTVDTNFRQMLLYRANPQGTPVGTSTAACELAFADGSFRRGFIQIARVSLLTSFAGPECDQALLYPGTSAGYLDEAILRPYFTTDNGVPIVNE